MSTTFCWCIHFCLPALMVWCPLLLVACRHQWADANYFLLMYTLLLPCIYGLMSTTTCCLPTSMGWCQLLFVDVYTSMVWFPLLRVACRHQWVEPTTFCWCIHFCLQTLMVWCPLLLAACRHQWVDVNYFLLMYTLLLASINGLMSTLACWWIYQYIYPTACQP